MRKMAEQQQMDETKTRHTEWMSEGEKPSATGIIGLKRRKRLSKKGKSRTLMRENSEKNSPKGMSESVKRKSSAKMSSGSERLRNVEEMMAVTRMETAKKTARYVRNQDAWNTHRRRPMMRIVSLARLSFSSTMPCQALAILRFEELASQESNSGVPHFQI